MTHRGTDCFARRWDPVTGSFPEKAGAIRLEGELSKSGSRTRVCQHHVRACKTQVVGPTSRMLASSGGMGWGRGGEA